MKVIWSVGFRGQGDGPFWSADKSVVTPEDRGRVIGDVIKKQCEIIRRHVKNPVLCTNLYSEMAELNEKGLIDFPDDVIKVWADNGYGKMVTRRNGNVDNRVHALPEPGAFGANGIYYHASFHDLQASNHMSMSPVSPEFIIEELNKCLAIASDYWVINCGNVKPHAYLLDLIREMWVEGKADADTHLKNYIALYYGGDADRSVYNAFKQYFQNALSFGTETDQKAGEQFYSYTVRNIIKCRLTNGTEAFIDCLKWVTGGVDEQIIMIKNKCEEKLPKWLDLQKETSGINLLRLHVDTHRYGCEGLLRVCESFELFAKKQYSSAFVAAFSAFRLFEASRNAFLTAGTGIWQGFYENDCLTNIAATVYACGALVKYIRIVGDNTVLNGWERSYLFDERSKGVQLLSAYNNPLGDEELYEKIGKVVETHAK